MKPVGGPTEAVLFVETLRCSMSCCAVSHTFFISRASPSKTTFPPYRLHVPQTQLPSFHFRNQMPKDHTGEHTQASSKYSQSRTEGHYTQTCTSKWRLPATCCHLQNILSLPRGRGEGGALRTSLFKVLMNVVHWFVRSHHEIYPKCTLILASLIPYKSIRNKLILWSKILLEKLIVADIIKTFPIFYATRSFVIVLTKARNCSLSWLV
jgi:hypothetical protein